MGHPYEDLQETAFWRTAVAEKHSLHISGLWQPRFKIGLDDRIVTAGSCFAQHFSRALVKRGYSWFNAEPAPKFLSADDASRFNYGIFSFRTGNIYTARILRQWLELAFGARDPIEEVWEKEGRFYDPLRPVIEPNGFASADEMLASRETTLRSIREAVQGTDVFVFTMGLTESWQNSELDYEYALCPETVAGTFDPDRDQFENQSFEAIQADMAAAIKLLLRENPSIRVMLTVSPVPLTATASGDHVLVATSYSKSVLRAVAGAMRDRFEHVDYFPSYEIITNAAFGGQFFAPNKRSVVPEGVDFVMRNFFADQERVFGKNAPAKKARAPRRGKAAPTQDDVRCEEEMLNAFAQS
ncbi:GSCFA domain-containing protein [Aliiroseovarius sp. KMU-50]|uniref:GSCFA domain-containing protein n=1 Tax=Aliiroseovarius salicola TaxID=3009082 RepID=A0ABT4VY83_9RHOB|nr:GSCFA domain-containing protein [Aliiroseovarius sp. KMU-50]MDA5093225.1 GSCFA domain-containing protein [Aliiroseovarius sp. KMU-50]